MAFGEQDSLQTQTCRNLYGALQFVGTYRRNGKTVLNLSPAWFLAPAESEPEDQPETTHQPPADLYSNLTEIEKRTWQKILERNSIPNIAAEEGVSRAAIYERIRGNSKGQGGMVSKNRWVALWWSKKRRVKNHVHDD